MANTLNRGWRIAAAGLGLNLAFGILYSWTIVARILSLPPSEGGWRMTASAATLPFATAVGVSAFWMYLAGRIQDRANPRWVVTAGGIFATVGLFVASLATPDSAWLLTLGFGVLVGSGMGLGNAPLVPVIAKWMPKARRGLATGIVVGGMGLASAYIAPLTEWLIMANGVATALRILGVGFLFLTLPLAQFIVNPPKGYVPSEEPSGDQDEKLGTSADPSSASKVAVDSPVMSRDYTTAEMLRTPQFYQLWTMYVLSTFAGLMVLGHMAKIAQAQLGGVNLGFVLVALLAIGNFSGRVLGGFAVDRLGGTRTKIMVFIAQALAMGLLWQANTTWSLVGIALLIGVLYGTTMSVFPSVSSHYFGTKHLGANYGVLFTAWGIAGMFGAMTGGAIVDATGSYGAAYAVAAALSLAAAGIAFTMRKTGH